MWVNISIWNLQFATEILSTDVNLSLPAKEYKVQVVTNEELSFLEMKMSWSPEGDLQFSIFREKGKQLKYVG